MPYEEAQFFKINFVKPYFYVLFSSLRFNFSVSLPEQRLKRQQPLPPRTMRRRPLRSTRNLLTLRKLKMKKPLEILKSQLMSPLRSRKKRSLRLTRRMRSIPDRVEQPAGSLSLQLKLRQQLLLLKPLFKLRLRTLKQLLPQLLRKSLLRPQLLPVKQRRNQLKQQWLP